MNQDTENRLDALLGCLAKDERSGWPEVRVALVERVLADAGATVAPVGMSRRQDQHDSRPGRIRQVFAFLADGWGAGAVAAMLAGLTIGLGVGFEGDVDLFDADTGPAQLSLADAGMLADDTLF